MSRKRASRELKHRNLPLLLLQAREHVIARFRPILNTHGITEQQWRIVRALLDTGPLEPREIGVLCRISSPSLAGVLSRMEEFGYIKRKRLDHDQRRLRVSLTARSRALAGRMAPQIEATYRQIEAAIGTEFSTRFYQALDELIGALGPLSQTRLPASRLERDGMGPTLKRGSGWRQCTETDL